MTDKKAELPNPSTLSILIAVILLAFTLINFISIPSTQIDFSLLGIIFPLKINFSTLVAVLVLGLTASGTAWLLQENRASNQYQNTIVHWLLPSLTAMVLLLILQQIPFSGIWWIAAFGSGLLLLLVFTAEYCVLDLENQYYQLAEIGISGLSLAFFLILAVGLHAAEIRLFLRVPVLSTAGLLIFLRVIHLRQEGRWAYIHGSAVFFLVGELAAGLHYLPLDSVSFGIALVGLLYAFIELSDRILESDAPLKTEIFITPGIVLVSFWLVAFAVL